MVKDSQKWPWIQGVTKLLRGRGEVVGNFLGWQCYVKSCGWGFSVQYYGTVLSEGPLCATEASTAAMLLATSWAPVGRVLMVRKCEQNAALQGPLPKITGWGHRRYGWGTTVDSAANVWLSWWAWDDLIALLNKRSLGKQLEDQVAALISYVCSWKRSQFCGVGAIGLNLSCTASHEMPWEKSLISANYGVVICCDISLWKHMTPYPSDIPTIDPVWPGSEARSRWANHRTSLERCHPLVDAVWNTFSGEVLGSKDTWLSQFSPLVLHERSELSMLQLVIWLTRLIQDDNGTKQGLGQTSYELPEWKKWEARARIILSTWASEYFEPFNCAFFAHWCLLNWQPFI